MLGVEKIFDLVNSYWLNKMGVENGYCFKVSVVIEDGEKWMDLRNI